MSYLLEVAKSEAIFVCVFSLSALICAAAIVWLSERTH